MNDKFLDIACCRALYEDLLDEEVVYDEKYNRFHYPYSRVFAYCPNCGAKLPDYQDKGHNHAYNLPSIRESNGNLIVS